MSDSRGGTLLQIHMYLDICTNVYVHHIVCGLVKKCIITMFISKAIYIYVTKFIQNKI